MVMPVAFLVIVLHAAVFAQADRVPEGACSAARPPRAVTSSKAVTQFRRSQESLDYNRIDEAIRHLGKGIQLDPSNVNAYNDLGTIYFNINEPQKAIEAFSKMIELEPHCFRGYLNLAFTLFSQKRYSEAETAARRALDLSDADERARYLLGSSLAQQGKNLPEAIEHLTAAAPMMVEARFQLAHVLIDMGELERGMREMQLYSIESQQKRRGKMVSK